MYSKKEMTANQAWKEIINKYSILDKIKKDGMFTINEIQINKYKEAKLMTNWDSSEFLPNIFRKNKINILPTSRSSYTLSDFNLYQNLPVNKEKNIIHATIPHYESLDVEKVTSKSSTVKVAINSNILNDFLGTDNNLAIFDEYVGTTSFDFYFSNLNGNKRQMSVNNAKYKIDCGLENKESFIVLQAKNFKNADFNIGNFYYPYRFLEKHINKPVRLVFLIYSNFIYSAFEYKFEEKNDFSSIELLNHKDYSFQNTKIKLEDIKNTRLQTNVNTDDNREKSEIPFIQVNSFGHVISLLENLYNNPMTAQQIAEFMNFEKRQAYYYFSAGRYLGLFQKIKDEDDNNKIVVFLTPLGERIFKMPYKQRQLSLVKQILEHKIFMEFFDKAFECGEIAQINDIKKRMAELNVCGESELHRRAGSVRSWLKWIFDLVDNENV